MDFSFNADQRALRDQIIKFARKELNHDVVERDAAKTFPRDLWLKCGDMGLQGLTVPEEFGGANLDSLTTAIAIEALGYGCEDSGLVFAVCAHLLACVTPIWKYGTQEQKERYLPDLCSGRRIAVNAMTEPESGSDAFNMRTRARRDGDDYIINGVKTFSSNGPIADVAVVYARTDDTKGYLGGITGFLVDKGTPGFMPGQAFDKSALRTCPIGELVFEDVRVPESAIIGKVGAGGPIFNQSMEWERTCLVAAHLGKMERLLEKSIDYAKTRSSFGKLIGQNQAVSHRIVDMKVRLEAARLLTYRAAMRLETSKAVGLDASMAKLFTSEALLETAIDTVRVLGGYGLMTEYGAERALRDAMAGTIYSGTNDMQRNIIAGWLGLSSM
ncbi:acyl-CoA dehydrogenase family protein [Hyphomonas johnsonii]|jgi:alkylation response protein AidB-like acyl-CoA dehydrogenase|uniref:Acyl-CoA dehydrogenase n=1 Tax=Hyphomonas johnsonii MHS-2 TaxID=1280950 RepID=A0A059FVW0_9PROT|nr:acyl-CoA dehydrogenase family protein [Hyphomonas johnsonii]KCZ94553.1 acyl-CoA dehydrogenase [Hyphomonas johnsonii MHS-2]